MFAFEADDIVPDVVALSKTLGGGFPLAAVAVTDSIAAAAERNGFRFLTSHMNEPSMAMIGLTMLALARRHVEQRSAQRQGEKLRAALTDLAGDHEIIGDVRGRGLLLVQVVSANVWRIAPPLTVSDDETDQAISIIHDSLTEYRPR
jgi:2,2-dialkylglycine decarboxylase (pyruvate)